jgi:hypothetical protein
VVFVKRPEFLAARPDGRSALPIRVAVAALIAGCFWMIAIAFQTAKTDPEVKLPDVIESLTPSQDALTVPKQSPVIIDFVFGYTGELNVDGTEIPKDQTTYAKATGVLTFAPARGKVLEFLPGGARRATITYWPVGSDRETSGQSFTWNFTVT